MFKALIDVGIPPQGAAMALRGKYHIFKTTVEALIRVDVGLLEQGSATDLMG